MRELFKHHDRTLLGYYRSILDAEGIASFIRGEHEQKRHPSIDPVLCVVDDDELDTARNLLEPHIKPPSVDKADWTCQECKEAVPASFETCWKCGSHGPQL